MADNSNRTSNLGPRVSHVTTKAFTAGPGHYLIPSWMTLEVDGPTTFDGAITAVSGLSLVGGLSAGTVVVNSTQSNVGTASFGAVVVNSTLSQTGLARFSDMSSIGNVALTGTFALGASGTSFTAIRMSTFSVSPGAVAANDSISTTATISLMPADSIVLGIQPASIWSGAYFDVNYVAKVSAASTLQLGFANSAITSVTPDAMNWTVVYADPS